MAEDVHVRVSDGLEQAWRQLGGGLAQQAVHARDHHVQARKQFGLLVEAAIGEDVDLDAGEDAKGSQRLVKLAHDFELGAEAAGVQAARDLERRRVVREDDVLMAERDGRLRHLLDRRAAV